MATYESIDATDTAQLLYIRGVNPDFQSQKSILCMPSLYNTTKGSDLFSAIEACINRYNLPWDKLCGLTDGAPAMTEKNNGIRA